MIGFPWMTVVACVSGTIACLFVFLYGELKIKYRRLSENLQSTTTCFEQQQNELEKLKKQQSESFDFDNQEATKSLIVSFTQKGIITYVNDYALEVFGFSQNELLNHSIVGTIFLAEGKKSNDQLSIAEKILLNPQLYIDVETKNFKKDGTPVWVSWTNRVVYDENNTPKEIRSVGFDISKRKKLEEKLKCLTSVDPLTGTLNRFTFLSFADVELKRAIRYNRAVSLLIVELDNFRLLGQEYGYTFGDEALQTAVKLCRDSIRESDLIGRIGDVEFAILLPETTEDNVHFLIERLHLQIDQQNLRKEVGGSFITARFGVASKQDDNDSIDLMLLRAKQNLKEYNQYKE